MNKGNRIGKNKRNEKISLRIMILLFSIISFYTSYTGLLKLSGVSEYNYVLKIFMAMLVGALQFALVFSINAFYIKDIFRKDWIKAISLLLIYIITMTFSVTFSFSYWYEEFSAESYAQRSSEMQLNRVKDSLLQAKHSFEVMQNSLTKLSEYSATASNRERIYGRTCDPKVGSGEGVYTWLRADDSKYTKSYSDDIKKLKNELDSEIEQVSSYLKKFDPKGDVVRFNQEVNSRINQINISFFENQTLKSLEKMLIERSGSNRSHITVLSRKTGDTSVASCIDRDFTIGARKVLRLLRALKPIETLSFFDMSDTKKLFGRTVGVLTALVNPTYTIKDTDKITDPADITYDDIYAVSAGFVIDFLILLITLYAKEPKEDLVSIEVVKKILNGEYADEVFGSLKLFIAELNSSYLLAIPNDADDEKISNLKILILYMQQNRLLKLYINGIKASRLNKYFNKHLLESYPDTIFKIYKINKKSFNKFILQNVEVGGTYNV